MNATERLQAAIETLERLKAEAMPGPWMRIGREIVALSFADTERHVATVRRAGGPDADLILTLHRTIDAQLAFLNHAVKFLGSVGRHTSIIAGPFIDDALALADAILGEA